MTRIQFYSNVADKQALLVSLVEKAMFKQRQVTVFAEDVESAATVSDCLWQNQPVSFLPHTLAHYAYSDRSPVIIACKKMRQGS